MNTIIYGNGSMARVLYSYARHSMGIDGFTVDDACIGMNGESILRITFGTVQQCPEGF